MPPRNAPGSGSRGSHGGGPARGGQPRGGGPAGRGRGAGPGALVGGPSGQPSIGAHVRTVGVKRPGYGRAGRKIALITNSFVADIPDVVIRHYDVAITPSTLPARLNMILIDRLQTSVAPDIFAPRAVYDGRKNMFASHDLRLGSTDSREFDVSLASNGNGGAAKRPPKIYKVKVTKVAQINPEILRQFVNGQQTPDNEVLTAIMTMNVAIRMDPNQKYPFNTRSFFTDREKFDIGGGITLWRGYFQSVRPSIGRLLINVDISTGMMYKAGSLIDLCLDFFEKGPNPSLLSGTMPDRERLRLQKFLSSVRITTSHTNGNRGPTPRVIKKLSKQGANNTFFNMNGHGQMSVAQYFQQHANKTLRFPQLLCVEVGSGALLPLELCTVPPGQLMRRQVPQDKTDKVVQFSTMKPHERFESILKGRDVLSYGQSDYVRTFGMNIKTAEGLLNIEGRVLDPPVLKYGTASKQPTIKPRDGSWNMIDKRFFKPVTIDRWVIVSYEGQRFFPPGAASDMVKGFTHVCTTVGITVREQDPLILYENGQGNIATQLRAAGAKCAQKNKAGGPNLIVVVLPGDSGNDIYTAVKNFGDTRMGVATQCLKSNKCRNAKPQYWANVCLKINVKLGGINSIPDPSSARLLTDPNQPTIVLGADVQHPAPGADASQRPSFTSVVGSVDGNCAKYVATTKVQQGRVELIADLKQMCKHVISLHINYRQQAEKVPNFKPTRLIFYRDGVSEGQFQQVLDEELPLIRAACDELGIKPKITLVVVGKRHHVRFNCQNPREADRSGNCPAGTVVDKDIGHPTEFDFYLQSHAGIIGTSRPAHYSVLYDQNSFDADSMQALSFMLCHVYARATRSVSIPAPVYYADIVCARSKNHYDPEGSLHLSETVTQTDGGGPTLDAFISNFKPLHGNQEKLMFFS